MLLVVFSL